MSRALGGLALVGLLLAGPVPAAAAEQPSEPEILAMSPEMGRFLARRVKPGQGRQPRLQALLDAIFGRRGLDIDYSNQRTRTAAQTFEERSGNCLSFTLMFVSMARYLGLNAYFREVDEVTSWDQRGDVVVTERHMFAEVEIDNGLVTVDFLPGASKLYRSTKRVDRQRVHAHFYSNLGVELLTSGRPAAAVPLFERALANDPGFGQAVVNLGVAWRRLGHAERAEEYFVLALAQEPGNMSAASNLASLYLAQGRRAEAEPLEARVAGYLRRNPFHHFRLGLNAGRRGDPAGAIDHLREAIRRRPREARFHLELGRLLAETGQGPEARASLERALRLAADAEERRRARVLLTELDPAR